MSVEFRATAFDTFIYAPTIQSSSFTSPPDAHASVSVTLANMKQVFKMKTYDTTGEYVRFFIDKPKFFQYIVLSDAVMETSGIYASGTQDISLNSGSNQFAHDFLRYISFKVFGSTNGVGMFTNKSEVITAITDDFIANYEGVLTALDSSQNTVGVKANSGLTVEVKNDAVSGFYVDSSGGNQNSLNIGWTLFQNLVSSNWARASAFLAASTPDALTDFPFEIGDTISVFVTVNADPQQKSVSTLARSSIDSRTYRIRIKIV